ncbi:MAG: hypothetical protein ACOC2H_09585 [Spirochaetota bacterium]
MFIEFLNVCLSNFAQEDSEDAETFFKAYQAHFNAEVAFLQADYKRSFKNIFQSQDINVALYNDVLNRYYLLESKRILDRLAPSIIKSKNSAARHYLTLGYRDRALARNIQTIGLASRPNLRSHKIYNYVEAIKYSRRSIRYALLALFESQEVETRKYIYNHLFESEREANNPFFNRFLNKNDQEYVAEINREHDDYEEEYGPQLEEDLKRFEDTGEIPNRSAGRTGAGEEIDTGIEPPGSSIEVSSDDPRVTYLYEKKIERRLRFRQEKKVAEYLRNGDFKIANDIIVQYVDDFAFKIIQATIEVMQAREDENNLNLDFQQLAVHHLDNYGRLSGDSLVDSFADRVRVLDDIPDSNGEATDRDIPDEADLPDEDIPAQDDAQQ